MAVTKKTLSSRIKEEAADNTTDIVMETDNKVEVSEFPNEKIVRIKLSKDHSCNIGGRTFSFEKGKIYEVPVAIKSVLSRGDLLRPLN